MCIYQYLISSSECKSAVVSGIIQWNHLIIGCRKSKVSRVDHRVGLFVERLHPVVLRPGVHSSIRLRPARRTQRFGLLVRP